MSTESLLSNQEILKPPNQANMRRNSKKSPAKNNSALVNSNLMLKALIGCNLSDCICVDLWSIYLLSSTKSFMNYELDQQLKQLINQAQKLDKSSIKRRKIVDYLIRLIQKSNELNNLQRNYHNSMDIFQEGVHQAYIFLNKSLEKYDIRQESSFMAWFLTVVRHKIIDILRARKRKQEKEIALVITNSDGEQIEIELPAPEPDNSMSPSQKIREIITVDPEIKLQKNLSRQYRDWRHKIHLRFLIFVLKINHLVGYFFLYQSLIITPSKIFILRLDGKSAREIAIEFGVKTKNPAQTAYRWIDYFDKSESKKAELNAYIDRYLSDWEEIHSEYL